MRAEQLQRGVADRQPRDRGDHRQDDALGDELPRDPPFAGAERQPGGELLQPRARSHQHEVGDVDAADQQHEQRAAPHQVERRLDFAHQRVLQRIDGGVEAGVDQQRLELRELLEVARVDRVDLLLRPRHARAGLEPADVLPAVVVAHRVALLLRRERQRPPQHHVRVEEVEALRHHADDRERLAVDPDVLADHRRIAAELRLPQRVAQHDLLLVADLAFGLG